MNTPFDFISKMTWQDWAAAGSFIFGIFTLIAYLEQRRTNKQQASLIEFAKRNVKKDISKEELHRLETKKATIETQISQKLPVLARTAVLKEQVGLHAQAIAEHFKQWKIISTELNNTTIDSGLDPAIEKVVLERILPQYEIQATRDKLRTRVTILSLTIAVVGSILPSTINGIVTIAIALILIPSILNLAKSLGELSSKQIRWIYTGIFALLELFLIGFGVILLVSGLDTTAKIIGWVFIGIGFLFGLALLILYLRDRMT